MPSSRITQIESSAQSAPMSTTGGIWSRHQPYLVYVHPCDTLRIRRRLRECALLRRAARPTLSDRCGSNIGQSAKAGLELGVDRKQVSAAGELVLRLPLTPS